MGGVNDLCCKESHSHGGANTVPVASGNPEVFAIFRPVTEKVGLFGSSLVTKRPSLQFDPSPGTSARFRNVFPR